LRRVLLSIKHEGGGEGDKTSKGNKFFGGNYAQSKCRASNGRGRSLKKRVGVGRKRVRASQKEQKYDKVQKSQLPGPSKKKGG